MAAKWHGLMRQLQQHCFVNAMYVSAAALKRPNYILAWQEGTVMASVSL